jgi:hypothetical protein
MGASYAARIEPDHAGGACFVVAVACLPVRELLMNSAVPMLISGARAGTIRLA